LNEGDRTALRLAIDAIMRRRPDAAPYFVARTDERDADASMEVGLDRVDREEAHTERIGSLEDEHEAKRERLRLKRLRERKK
jgi:SPT2 chromatin protein